LSRAGISLAAENTWKRKADIPTARGGQSSSVVDGKIYVIGGNTSEPNPQLVMSVEVYDPITDSWTQKADIPTGRTLLSTSVVDGKIYVIGGTTRDYVGRSTLEVYDPATDTWTRKADMPTPRAALSASAVNGKIYVMGGARNLNYLVGLPTVEEYDPATDIWTRKADMPTPKFALCTSVVDGQIYTIGGGTYSSPGREIVEAYDPATDTWTRKANMPTARRNFSTCVIGGKIYAIGGWVRSSLYAFTTVEQYDPVMDAWTIETDLPVPRAFLSANAIDGKIYAIGGTDRSHPCPALSTLYVLTIGGTSPDLNGDGIVGIKDLQRLIESWGQDDSLVDIAPPPFGDGIVDALDLELLMNYWEQSVDDPTLTAHWALDETEGTIAWDSAGTNDAVTFGDPLWLPTGGIVDGAIQLDGVDDCVIIGSIPNPAEGPFSVLAWIQGGEPGQVVISQITGANWLTSDVEGNLMTELRSPARDGGPLQSQTKITDGNWHRIGLVWDGSIIMLYVDDVLVAEDTQDGLETSDDGLYIGCGKGMESGTFWSGIIDDIRIYNRVVIP
jgi:N-acetylneuraminic acid mutarotase